jgi:zinc protease
MNEPMSGFEVLVMPNGMRIFHKHMKDRITNHIGFIIHSGAGSDIDFLPGTAHFVEHMVSANLHIAGKHTPLKSVLSTFKEAIGIEPMLGSTSYDTTCYSMVVPSDNRGIAKHFIAIFEDMLLSGQIEHALEREKGIISGEFNREIPSEKWCNLHDLQNRRLYGSEHCRTKTFHILGTKKSIAEMNLETLNAFRNKFYIPENMSIVSVGGFTNDQLVEMINDSKFALSTFMGKKNTYETIKVIYPPNEPLFADNVEAYRHGANDAFFEAGSLLSIENNHFTVSLTSELVSEMLFNIVRERESLTYNIVMSMAPYKSHYELWALCHSLNSNGAKKITDLLNEACQKVSEDKDALCKLKHTKRVLVKYADISHGWVFNRSFSNVKFCEKIITLQEMIESIENVEIDDVQEIIEQFMTNKWTVLLS